MYHYLLGPQFLLTLVLTVGFYVSIAKIAYEQHQRVQALEHPLSSVEALKSHKSKKVTKNLGTLLGVYLVSILPQFFISLALQTQPTRLFWVVEKFTVVLFWSNTWVNPIIYALRMKEFRTPLKKLLRCGGQSY